MLKTSSCPGITFVRDLAAYVNNPPPPGDIAAYLRSPAPRPDIATYLHNPRVERSFDLISSFQPRGVTDITLFSGGTVALHIKDGETPVIMDSAYALAIFAGLALGGVLRFNHMARRNAPNTLQAEPCNCAVAGLVLDLNANSFECAEPRNGNHHDFRRSNLQRRPARRATNAVAPRRDFIMTALELFDRHASDNIDLTRENYFGIMCWAFELADFEHPTTSRPEQNDTEKELR